MRHLGSLEDRDLAVRFHDYMLVRGVDTKVDREGDEWSLWVVNEDHVDTARSELESFLASPDEERYVAAATAAEHVRTTEERKVRRLQQRQRRFERRMNAAGQPIVTFILISASVLCTAFATNFRDPGRLSNRASVVRWLTIQDFDPVKERAEVGLTSIERGEVWRLVTPIFLHFGYMHLLFNMMWLRQLGAAIEFRRGKVPYIALVLVIAIGSNLIQFATGGLMFGGMSGVVFGLFGYVWMRGRFHPGDGLYAPRSVVTWMMVWLALCTFGVVGAVAGVSIANGAHAGGLAIGCLIGWWPSRGPS